MSSGENVCLYPGGQTFLTHRKEGGHFSLTRGDKKNLHTRERLIFNSRRGGGQTFQHQEVGKHFYFKGEQTFHVGYVGGFGEVGDERKFE